MDPEKGPATERRPLPFFDGKGWGGGPTWPDPTLGWARLTAEGGHPGDDLGRAVVRRWTSPIKGTVAVESTLQHDPAVGDGVRGWLSTSRGGILKQAAVHAGKADFDAEAIEVEPGDAIDFTVDVGGGLNSDQFLWAPKVRVVRVESGAAPATGLWDARRDFLGPMPRPLSPRELLAQTLLISNEFMFVD